MMQRWCTRLRSLAAHSPQPRPSLSSSPLRRLHCSPHHLQPPYTSSIFGSILKANVTPASQSLRPSLHLRAFPSPPLPLSLLQVRHVSSRERKKRRKPATPVVSKVKKIKMKSYSSYKSRFRTLNDGTIRRWKEGKRHNAHVKSKKSKRRLRKPALVPAAYALVMKKLNFCG